MSNVDFETWIIRYRRLCPDITFWGMPLQIAIQAALAVASGSVLSFAINSAFTVFISAMLFQAIFKRRVTSSRWGAVKAVFTTPWTAARFKFQLEGKREDINRWCDQMLSGRYEFDGVLHFFTLYVEKAEDAAIIHASMTECPEPIYMAHIVKPPEWQAMLPRYALPIV